MERGPEYSQCKGFSQWRGRRQRAHAFVGRLGELDVAALLTDLYESGSSEFADDFPVG